jgi:hypothetical protein
MLMIAADPKHLGARIGITSVLHTWGSALTPSRYEIYYVRATDKETQRLNGLSTAMAGFAALPNNSSLPLGDFRAIARSGIFDGLRLRRREAFADLLGAARGIKRRLRVALELRHHLACDQFVAAHCC